jgi:hypothetical protein
VVFIFACAEQKNILLYDGKTKHRAEANLQSAKWLAGHWRGETPSGTTELIWSPPLGNSMMGTFKLVENGKVKFYQMATLVEEENQLEMKVKHFRRDLKGREPKDSSLHYPLLKVTEDRLYFSGLTYEKVNFNEMKVYEYIPGAETEKEIQLTYYRYEP